jgi:hypothetical protein
MMRIALLLCVLCLWGMIVLQLSAEEPPTAPTPMPVLKKPVTRLWFPVVVEQQTGTQRKCEMLDLCR